MTDQIASSAPPAPLTRNTRQDILDAAQRLFTENGYHGTSMRRIAEEAGISLGAAYNHFASKEDIFLAVFIELHPYRDLIARIVSAQGDDIEALMHDAAHNLEDGLLARPDQFLALMFIELVEFKGKHISGFFQEIFPQIIVASQRFFSNRENLRGLPPLIQLRGLLGLFFSYFITEWVFGENLPPEARENGLHYMVDIYLHGIMKPDSKEAA